MNESGFRFHVEPLDEGGFVATSPDVPGLVPQGKSIERVTAIAQKLVCVFAKSYRETGDPMPTALKKRLDAFADLRELRKQLPKLPTVEIVAAVHESRKDLA